MVVKLTTECWWDLKSVAHLHAHFGLRRADRLHSTSGSQVSVKGVPPHVHQVYLQALCAPSAKNSPVLSSNYYTRQPLEMFDNLLSNMYGKVMLHDTNLAGLSVELRCSASRKRSASRPSLVQCIDSNFLYFGRRHSVTDRCSVTHGSSALAVATICMFVPFNDIW